MWREEMYLMKALDFSGPSSPQSRMCVAFCAVHALASSGLGLLIVQPTPRWIKINMGQQPALH